MLAQTDGDLSSQRETIIRAAQRLRKETPFWASKELPWRQRRTPYRIFLAELLLVRTRADVVAAIFEDVFGRFPTVDALASAPEADVALALAPLGLRKRVPILIRGAKFVVEEFGGKIPQRLDELVDIPGIGLYTAAAISAFAFGHPQVPADVNVLRFLARLTGLEMEHRTKGSKSLRSLLPLLSEAQGGPQAEILLDFARLICRPRKPRCAECALSATCSFALALDLEHEIGVS
jgi:A/G-specific adenine glycosylase